MTALASWCLRDQWIKNLPADEIVPMLFSMGKDRTQTLECLKSSGLTKIRDIICAGLSVDEPDVLSALESSTRAERFYLFSSHGWTSASAKSWIEKFQKRTNNAAEVQ
jgi:hypothetical protein